MTLHRLLADSARRNPEAVAVLGAHESLSYGEIDRLANRVARALIARRVGPGDRVGVLLEKSPRSIAALQGVLRTGAAYVPLDPLAPPSRSASIVADCRMKVIACPSSWAHQLLVGDLAEVEHLELDAVPTSAWERLEAISDEALEVPNDPSSLAYILYTSGSTGVPKGVCISHVNALAFILWARDALGVTAADRLSNHAPFHFDLSVLDLYVAFAVGASVAIVPEYEAYSAERLVAFLAARRPTIWYSVPSALVLMLEHGGLASVVLPPRAVLFAGEPFAIGPLQRLRTLWPHARFMNLYGPTETNVCTAYELPSSLEGRDRPVPIGAATCGDRVWAEKEDGSTAAIGEEGELLVSGPTVMLGYWGAEPQGQRPYRTGDIVVQLPGGDYQYVGRRDHMVKLHGFRIELGEVEAAIASHPQVRECAVVVGGEGMAKHLVAFIVPKDKASISLVALKRHCAERLPRYMIIHRARQLAELPRTRNGKVDHRRLAAEASGV